MRRVEPTGLLTGTDSIGALARAVQEGNPPWRVGLDLRAGAWFAMREYSPTCRRWVYGNDLLSLSRKLTRLRGESFLP
jgi:hypothetical protein